jgi:hypothetical protein
MGENRDWSKSSNGTRERRVWAINQRMVKYTFHPPKNMRRVSEQCHKPVPASPVQILITRSNISAYWWPQNYRSHKKERRTSFRSINMAKKTRNYQPGTATHSEDICPLSYRHAGRDTSDIAPPQRVAAAHAIALSRPPALGRPEATSASSDHGLTAPPPRPRRSGRHQAGR